jgi:hypothetical protein
MDFKKKYLKYKYKYLKLKQSGGAPSPRIQSEIESLKSLENSENIRMIEWDDQESTLTVTLDRDFLAFNFNDSYPFIAPSLSVNGERYLLSRLLPFGQWGPTTTIESIIEKFIERGKNPQNFDQELKDKIAAKERSNKDRKLAAEVQESEFGTSEEDQEVLLKQFQTMQLEKEKKENKNRAFTNLIERLREIDDIRNIRIEDYSFILETIGRTHYPLTLKIEFTDKFPYTVLLTNITNNNNKELRLNEVSTFLNDMDNRQQLWEPRKVSTKK